MAAIYLSKSGAEHYPCNVVMAWISTAIVIMAAPLLNQVGENNMMSWISFEILTFALFSVIAFTASSLSASNIKQ